VGTKRTRAEIKEALVRELDIEQAHDGVRLVTLKSGVVLGRLRQAPETGRWLLDWRAGWMHTPSEWVGSGQVEHAEKWAVNEIAESIAMEREAIDAGKPWGDSPPAGVG
jgi:hypothetical protein